MAGAQRNPFSSDWLQGQGGDHRLKPQGGLSYVAGPGDEELKFITVAQLLDRACARHGAGDAAIFAASGQRLSWYDLKKRSDEVAAGLLALGIGRGDRVGIWAPNREEWLLTQFGTARIGAILVNINPAYRQSELGYAPNKVQCKALVTARSFRSRDYLATLQAISREQLPHLKHVVVLDDGPLPSGAVRFSELLR